ncbi:MAG: patatin-like phospholipase family protein [Xanthobacteraceae bacterium]|nr:patatin-like phospholipase family protein [Xanthobacteraceae bacterium]
MYDAICFAGGGNRCYWQGGFFEAASEKLDLKAPLMTAVSAGSFALCYSLLGIGSRVRELVISGCGPHLKNFDLKGWRAGKPLYPVGAMYRDLLREVFDEEALRRLQSFGDILVAVARLPRGLPPVVGAALGIGAYQVEKKLFHPVHPVFGRKLGIKQEFINVRGLQRAEDLHDLIMASGGVPPFMPVTKIGQRAAFDGGLVDNVPVTPLEPVEAHGGKTLVLVTRVYRKLPKIPGRTYVQPSEPIPIKQFDIRNADGFRKAYELGLKDGKAFAARTNRL